MKSRTQIIIIVALSVLLAVGASAQTQGNFGIRGGLGTDVGGGIAYGIGGNYILPLQQNHVEFAAVLFGGSYDETSDNGWNEYEESTDLMVFGAMGNFLFGYEPLQSSTYFIAGMGLGVISMSWEEKSDTDESLGTPLPGGGSMQSEEGTAGGTIFNFGIGHSFESGFNLRAEFPIIVAFSAPGEAGAVAPNFMITAGLMFK